MSSKSKKPTTFSNYVGGVNRRNFIKGAGAMSLMGILAACQGRVPEASQEAADASNGEPFGRPLKAAFCNVGLANSWPAQGKEATDLFSEWLGVDVTWYDGGLSIDTQREAIDDMATKDWDFVAIQAFGIDTLVDPVKQMIAKGIPVIQMDTIIATEDPGVTTFLEPDNVLMGETVAETLFNQIGGSGTVIMTQGALGHSGAQKRAQGFYNALERYPDIELLAEDTADWDVNKTVQLWEDYLVQYDQIDAGFFHSDDMGIAASQVLANAGRENDTVLGSIDAMPEAIEAVQDGRLLVSIRNSTCRIHWGALVIGALAATGVDDIPKYILIDGPVVTKGVADGLLFMEEQYLL